MVDFCKSFYRVGGTTRISGFMLAGFTFLLLIVGTAPIGYIRELVLVIMHSSCGSQRVIAIMLVGALIFVLGIDLVKEAMWDTRHRVSWPEYLTIASIVVCMTLWDFVIGVLFGIVVCCACSCYLVTTMLNDRFCNHRLLLCCAELTKKEHKSDIHRRIGNVCRKTT